VAALLSWLGWFIGTAASMTGEWSEILESDILEAVLFETQFGRLWIARLALLAAILTLTLAWRRQIRARQGFMLLLSPFQSYGGFTFAGDFRTGSILIGSRCSSGQSRSGARHRRAPGLA
jgi:hypothetical protein